MKRVPLREQPVLFSFSQRIEPRATKQHRREPISRVKTGSRKECFLHPKAGEPDNTCLAGFQNYSGPASFPFLLVSSSVLRTLCMVGNHSPPSHILYPLSFPSEQECLSQPSCLIIVHQVEEGKGTRGKHPPPIPLVCLLGYSFLQARLPLHSHAAEAASHS